MPRQRRVAIVAAAPDIVGGQSVQAQALVAALRGDGVRVSFVPINPRFPAGLRWVRRVPYVRTVLNQLLYLPSLFRLASVDVAHVFSAAYASFLIAPLPAMMAARLFRKRVVLHYHSGEADDHLATWGVLVHPWLSLAHEIVVPSAYLAGVFKRYGYHATVVPNLVDVTQFGRRRGAAHGPRLLSARNLERYYRVDVILDAFARVKRLHPDATLTVAGHGSEEQTLKSAAPEGVTFVGKTTREQMPELYAQADIVLNASEVDNQPVTILEAFAAGVPVITTPAGDIPSMVEHERTGLIVPFNDAAAMAAAVTRLVDDRAFAAQLAQSAQAEVVRYTWEAVRNDWHAIYVHP
jgi:glycosyltransferase involved in cell wall biosynthesis